MSKDSCRFHTGNTQWSMWVCLLTWDCLSHYSFHDMAYKKMFNLVKLGVELKMNWLNGSIPISSGFQFQFKISQFKSNSVHAELNWIDYQFQFNSWIDPSPVQGCATLPGRYGMQIDRRTAASLVLGVPLVLGVIVLQSKDIQIL